MKQPYTQIQKERKHNDFVFPKSMNMRAKSALEDVAKAIKYFFGKQNERREIICGTYYFNLVVSSTLLLETAQ